jgi:hypothetical protein
MVVAMLLVQLDDWRQFYQEGDDYLGTAVRAARRWEVFTPEILYNLAAMAIEKYFMALLMRHGDLADNHTMRDLIDSVERHLPIAPDLAATLIRLDAFQEICALNTWRRQPLTTGDIPHILAAARQVNAFVATHLGRHPLE